MKPEHRSIIDNAKRHGCMPSELAHELLVHDLVEMARFELHNLKAPYHKLNEEAQQEVINRLTEKAEDAVTVAVRIITARGAASVPIEVRAIKVEPKALTVTAKVDAAAPDKHELTDSAGKLCLLVLAPDDYREGLDAIQPERDQHEMPMQAGDLLGSPEELEKRLGGGGERDDLEDEALLEEATRFVISSRRASISAIQRALKIGYNRAARLVEALEAAGTVSAMDSSGGREVIAPAPLDGQAEDQAGDGAADANAPGDAAGPHPTAYGIVPYSDVCAVLARVSPSVTIDYLQSRFAIGSDAARALVVRLLDDKVIAVQSEAENPLHNTYSVTKDLDDVVTME
ncbi:DNA translocase FtsK [Pseudomonas oryzihabitans]|uniref:DNA translocase FtsK n=1 Tax=Pseudomonas oryzihabitans TaxID=47885 RepID=UPI00241EA470|nr:DNA translocase FtsK [Pseudomonas oryzihabitans]